MPVAPLQHVVRQLGEPYYTDGKGRYVYHGDCRDLLAKFPDSCIDLIVTDPPYFVPSNSGSRSVWWKRHSRNRVSTLGAALHSVRGRREVLRGGSDCTSGRAVV